MHQASHDKNRLKITTATSHQLFLLLPPQNPKTWDRTSSWPRLNLTSVGSSLWKGSVLPQQVGSRSSDHEYTMGLSAKGEQDALGKEGRMLESPQMSSSHCQHHPWVVPPYPSSEGLLLLLRFFFFPPELLSWCVLPNS